MRRLAPESYLTIVILLATVVCSIPFTQEVSTVRTIEQLSDDHYQCSVAFGGPMVSRVNVICNRSAEIHFMYQNGTWIETENILLETVQARSVMFNFNAEHVTTVVQITSDGPFLVRIAYIYPIETQMSLFARALYEMELNQQLGTPV